MHERAWMNPRIELLETGTDWKTAANALGYFEGLTVRLTWRVTDPIQQVIGGALQTCDVRVIDVGAVFEGPHRCAEGSLTGGILVRNSDDHGEPIGDEWFVAYEDIEAIGVY